MRLLPCNRSHHSLGGFHMNARMGVGGAVLLLLFVACSSGPTLTVNPATLTVTAGSMPATITATLTDTSATVAWSLSGPGSLSAATGATTSYVPPPSANAAAPATVTATAGSLTATASVTVNPSAPTLTIHPKNLNVVAGARGSNFTATLTGSTDTISWSLVGPGSLATSTGPGTSYTPPTSAGSAMTATLTATAAGVTASANIGIPLPITVTGTAVFQNGLPAANASVVIGGQATTTDTGGHFTIPNVAAPYDLTVVTTVPDYRPSGDVPVGTSVMYQGLTRTNPIITILLFSPQTYPNNGKVTGMISGGDPPGADEDQDCVSFASPETTAEGGSAFPDPYAVFAGWSGPASTTGILHALRYAEYSAVASEYKGSATVNGVTVTDGGNTIQDITLTPVTAEHISGTIAAADPFQFTGTVVYLDFDDGARIRIAFDVSSVSSLVTQVSFDYLTPSGLGTISLMAGSYNASTTHPGQSWTYLFGLAPNATGVSLRFQAAPQLLSPADGGAAITTLSDFTWTAFAGGISYIRVIPQGSSTPTVAIVTAATTTTIPDLSVFGVGLASGGATYTWYVEGLAPYADMDTFAETAQTFPPSGTTVLDEASSPSQTFTTQ
jgi:hypothetical protein